MKTLLLKDSSLRVSVMSFHHEIVYSVMRAYFEALVSHVLIWNERSYGLLWNTEMVEDISERLRFFSKDTKRWRVYAVLFGVINLRRELRIVPFRDALEEHMSTGLNVSAVAVIDVHRIYETFGTKNVPEDVLEDFVNKYNAWHNSFEWFVRLFENGRLKSENRVCRTMDDVIMWLKHQPELVNVRITPKQFADARADVESDFGILVKKNFVLTGINALNRLEFRDGAMALRVAFDDLVRVHSELHDPESIGSVFWRQRRGASRQRHRLQHQARRHGIRANLRPRGHAAAHRRRSQEHAPGLPGGRTRPHRDRRVGRHLRAELHRR